MANPDLTQSIEQLARLKDEHRPILRQVAADPGMSPETRAALVEHLYEEEDEHVAEMTALAQRGGGGGGASDAPASRSRTRSPRTSGLSVGSLRPGAGAEPSQVGSLRPEYPGPRRTIAGGTVSGTLRTPPSPRKPGQTVGSLRGT